MEKYGVVTEVNEKTAEDVKESAGKKCPKCGNRISRDVNVHKCEIHGTEPFEKDPD